MVTMEKKGDSYVETWKKDGNTIITTSKDNDVTIKFPDGKQINVSMRKNKLLSYFMYYTVGLMFIEKYPHNSFNFT